jgi:hypothetical protein
LEEHLKNQKPGVTLIFRLKSFHTCQQKPNPSDDPHSLTSFGTCHLIAEEAKSRYIWDPGNCSRTIPLKNFASSLLFVTGDEVKYPTIYGKYNDTFFETVKVEEEEYLMRTNVRSGFSYPNRGKN